MTSIDKINNILAKRGMSGAELSRIIGGSTGLYSNWNTGKSKPSPMYLKRIASALDIPIESILDDGIDMEYGKAAQSSSNSITTAQNNEIDEMLDYIKSNPGMRILFSKAKNATPEQLLAIAQMIDTFRSNS